MLLVIISGTALLVFLGKFIAKKKIIVGRRPLPFEDIQRLTNPAVSIQTLSYVLTMLGNSYRLDPHLIRTDDRLKKFFDLDSWTLGLGTERINKWLADEGVTERPGQLVTVLDLMIFLERRKADVEPPSRGV